MLSQKIDKIGDYVVQCTRNCPGVCNDPIQGIIPRGLILETGQRENENGSVIIGINPGPVLSEEKETYLRAGRLYINSKQLWEGMDSKKGIKNYPYYQRLRNFVDQLGRTGLILWTDLVKCESSEKRKMPPMQTKRICSNLYLSKELNVLPEDWPIFAIGRDAYESLSLMLVNRIVIGIPNTTARGNQFNKIITKGEIDSTIKAKLEEVMNGAEKRAVWVDADNKVLV